MVPWRKGELVAATYKDGEAVHEADCWKTQDQNRTVHGSIPEPTDHLEGRHLFGGILFSHFGHLLTESASRLWATSGVDSIVFFPDSKRPKARAIKLLNKAFGPLPPITIIHQPTTIETLIIPEQGFGLREMSAGSPEFRAFADARLRGRGIGFAKLYVSRSRFPKNGRHLLERKIEQYLQQEGYDVFHPQEHDLEKQVAKYQTASIVLSSDNSAMFLAGLAMPKGGKVGIISRRLVGAGDSLDRLFSVAAEAETHIFRHISRQWQRGKPLWDLSLLDFKGLSSELQTAGFISNGWENPTEEEVTKDLDYWSNHFGEKFLEKK